MLDQQLGEKTRIQAARILKSIDGRILGNHPEIERRVSQREIKIDQQSALARLLCQGYRKIAGQSSH
ncbi:MAG: hypothetical protein WCA89_05360, partial [Terracidiphilus sp.]